MVAVTVLNFRKAILAKLNTQVRRFYNSWRWVWVGVCVCGGVGVRYVIQM